MSTEATVNNGSIEQKRKRWPWILAGLALVLALLSTRVSLFVIQPIGAIPEGRTLLVWRKGDMKLIDSPDAICLRHSGSVSLLCRGAAMMKAVDPNEILLRMPYSEQLYLISTNGKTYDQ